MKTKGGLMMKEYREPEFELLKYIMEDSLLTTGIPDENEDIDDIIPTSSPTP